MSGFFIYSDHPSREPTRSTVPYEKWNANKHWSTHRWNEITLAHIQRETPDAREKLQATREIEIALRKQRFWERHPNFDREGALSLMRKTYGTTGLIPARAA